MCRIFLYETTTQRGLSTVRDVFLKFLLHVQVLKYRLQKSRWAGTYYSTSFSKSLRRFRHETLESSSRALLSPLTCARVVIFCLKTAQRKLSTERYMFLKSLASCASYGSKSTGRSAHNSQKFSKSRRRFRSDTLGASSCTPLLSSWQQRL